MSQEKAYPPEFDAMLEQLRQDPTTTFKCAHDHEDSAIGIYHVPRGCVALPGLEVQPLCPQHVLTNGSFEGMFLLVDLTIGGGWSHDRGDSPEYLIIKDGETGKLKLTSNTKMD